MKTSKQKPDGTILVEKSQEPLTEDNRLILEILADIIPPGHRNRQKIQHRLAATQGQAK